MSSRELIVRYKDQQRQPLPAHAKPSLELLSHRLAMRGYHGEWVVDFQRQVRKRGNQRLTLRVAHGRLLAVIKAGGNDSAFEAYIQPPAGVPVESALMALSTESTRDIDEHPPASLEGFTQDDDTLRLILIALDEHADYLGQITVQEATHWIRKTLGIKGDGGQASGIYRVLRDRGYLSRVYIGSTHLGYCIEAAGQTFAGLTPRAEKSGTNGKHYYPAVLEEYAITQIRDDIKLAKAQRAAAAQLDAEIEAQRQRAHEANAKVQEAETLLDIAKATRHDAQHELASLIETRDNLPLPPEGYEAALGQRIIELLSA